MQTFVYSIVEITDWNFCFKIAKEQCSKDQFYNMELCEGSFCFMEFYVGLLYTIPNFVKEAIFFNPEFHESTQFMSELIPGHLYFLNILCFLIILS